MMQDTAGIDYSEMSREDLIDYLEFITGETPPYPRYYTVKNGNIMEGRTSVPMGDDERERLLTLIRTLTERLAAKH